MTTIQTPAPADEDLAALVGPVAYGEWQRSAPTYHVKLAAWARGLAGLSDEDFLGEAASAIHGAALTNSWRGNWSHEDFKATACFTESERRHRAAGHSENCRGRNLYTTAYYRVTRSQGYNWDETAPCDGTCGGAA